MPQERSRFGLNLLCQLILSLLLMGLAEQLPPGLQEFVQLGGTILLILFLFGLLYGFFRLFGMRSAGIEGLYQRVPLGLFAKDGASFGRDAMEQIRQEEETPKAHAHDDARPAFDWHALCSFKTLRYAGVVLIVSAVFSLLFKIDWTLIAKIWTAAGLGVVAISCAEWLKKMKMGQIASICALVSFALFQFTLTLLFTYAGEQYWSPLLINPHTWLALKFLLSCAFLFTVWRYPSDVQPLLYFAIAYVSPLTLLYVGAPLVFPLSLIFLACMSALVLMGRYWTERPSLILLNAGSANVYVAMLAARELAAGNFSPTLALIAYGLLFLLHLCVAVTDARRQKRLPVLDYVHLVSIHAFFVLGLLQVGPWLPIVDSSLGFWFLGAALCSFCAWLIAHGEIRDQTFNEVLLNLSILLSAAGLFWQTTGQWSAVVFLLYACGILWFSLYAASMRVRIYGFLVLGVSLVKLYLQFSEIFDSIPGSVAILLIGMLLVALSYKFEAVKHLVIDGMPRRKEV